jgi:nitroimidazol reductase NimA-like FMN-containing flavoprotein (pyridoxamine 5'-phosphate oxidase superfamily)
MLRVMNSRAPLSPTQRTQLARLRERGQNDRAELYAVLDAGLVCHLGVIIDGTPVVLPTGYGRVGDTLYLHGSAANRSMGAAAGQPVCVTVTHLDGIVLARSVFHHSVNYRSAMIFGTGRLVTDDPERLGGLQAIVEQLAPGRWDTARAPTRKELAATAVIALPLAEASVKVRSGPPADDPEDHELGLWTGVLPVRMSFGEPAADPVLPPAVAVPAHVRDRAMPANPREGQRQGSGGS